MAIATLGCRKSRRFAAPALQSLQSGRGLTTPRERNTALELARSGKTPGHTGTRRRQSKRTRSRARWPPLLRCDTFCTVCVGHECAKMAFARDPGRSRRMVSVDDTEWRSSTTVVTTRVGPRPRNLPADLSEQREMLIIWARSPPLYWKTMWTNVRCLPSKEGGRGAWKMGRLCVELAERGWSGPHTPLCRRDPLDQGTNKSVSRTRIEETKTMVDSNVRPRSPTQLGASREQSVLADRDGPLNLVRLESQRHGPANLGQRRHIVEFAHQSLHP